MADHNDFGDWGENQAVDFLEQKGYEIKARKYRFGKREIDIIARFEDLLIFIEVKTRHHSPIATPEESVTSKKKTLLIEAAHQYIESSQWEGEARFDIVSITMDGRKKSIRHIEDAFNTIY